MQLDMLVIAGSCSCTYAAKRFKYTSTLLTFHTVRRTVKELLRHSDYLKSTTSSEATPQ